MGGDLPSKIPNPDGDGMAGGDHVTALHRLFGDADGNWDVDFDDLGVLLTTLGRSAGDDAFLWYLDYAGDNSVDLTDGTAFGARYIQFVT